MRSQSDILPNTDLRPEASRMIACGFRIVPWSGVHATLRGYWRDTRDLIRGIEDEGDYRFINVDQVRFFGLDAQIMAGPWRGFSLDMILNVITVDDATNQDLPESPTFWGNGALSWQHAFFKGDLHTHLSLGIRAVSEFWTLTGDTPEVSSLISINTGTLLDVKATFIVIQNVRLSFAVDNVLDKDVIYISGYRLSGRMFRIGMSWDLLD